MEPPDFDESSPSPTRIRLQGPRPPQLRVRKESHMIKKPPIAPAPPHRPHQTTEPAEDRQPVIIYAVSPKVIHTTTNEFMSLVQRLTGSSSTSAAAASSGGDVSPAARLASLERASPKEREIVNDLMGIVEGVEIGQNPGILSPAPATLPPISPGLFTPVIDQNPLYSLLHDLSPNFSNFFMPSPSTLFSAPMVSPSPSSFDFNPFFDF